MRSRRKKKNPSSRIMLMVLAVFGLAILWVWKATEAHSLSRELTRLEQTKKEMIEQNKHLKAELERYHSIAWIDSQARKYRLTYEVKERQVLFDKPVERDRANRNLLANMADMISKSLKAIID